jgi:hypothetical protein
MEENARQHWKNAKQVKIHGLLYSFRLAFFRSPHFILFTALLFVRRVIFLFVRRIISKAKLRIRPAWQGPAHCRVL